MVWTKPFCLPYTMPSLAQRSDSSGHLILEVLHKFEGYAHHSQYRQTSTALLVRFSLKVLNQKLSHRNQQLPVAVVVNSLKTAWYTYAVRMKLSCLSLEHFVCVCGLSGSVYAWGMGTNLQLGTGEEDDEWSPVEMTGKQLEGRAVLSVSSGGQHTVLLVRDKQES